MHTRVVSSPGSLAATRTHSS